MIIVELRRAWCDETATLGMLTVHDFAHDPIFTLENPLRDTIKDSRIPAGEYRCVPYTGTRYKDVYMVLDVPGRSAILFHWGNFETDTEGCILLGSGAGMIGGVPAVTESKKAFDLFRSLIGKNIFTLRIL